MDGWHWVFCFICFILSRAFSHFCLEAEPATVSSRTLKQTATTCSLSPIFKGQMGHNCYPSLICKLVLVTSLNAVTKHQQEATLGDYVCVYFGLQFEGALSTMAGKACCQELEVTGPAASIVVKERVNRKRGWASYETSRSAPSDPLPPTRGHFLKIPTTFPNSATSYRPWIEIHGEHFMFKPQK